MKKKILICILIIFLFLITIFGHLCEGSFLFARGSDGLMQYTSIGIFIKLLLLLFFSISLFLCKKKYLIILFFCCWLLSGRMVGIFPDGRIITGWFFIQTKRIDLCNNVTDCEKVIYETQIEKLPLGFIRIKNKRNSSLIFIGPLIWNRTTQMLEKSYG